MDEYIGTVSLFAFDYETPDWFKCDGRELPISRYQALFALLGTRYGGDGVQKFNLPKLDSPDQHMHYYICINGIFPPRD